MEGLISVRKGWEILLGRRIVSEARSPARRGSPPFEQTEKMPPNRNVKSDRVVVGFL